MAKEDNQQKIWAQAVAPVMDDLVSGAIQRTPGLSEHDFSKLRKRRRKIIGFVEHLFPPSPLDDFFTSHKRAAWVVWFLCAAGAGIVLRSGTNRVNVIGQLFLACIVGIFVSWCIYYARIILKPLSYYSSIILGLAGFVLTFWWWVSPLAPIAAHPDVVAKLDGSNIGGAVRLSGSALLPSKTHLWMFAIQQNQWWPLKRIEVDYAGQWAVLASPADIRHIGCDIVLAVVSVNETADQQIQAYLQRSRDLRVTSSLNMPLGATVQRSFHVEVPGCQPSSSEITRQKANQQLSRQKYPWGANNGLKFNFNFIPQLAPERRADLERSVESASRQIHNAPSDSAAYQTRGYALSELGDQDGAEADYNQSIQLRVDALGFNGRGLARLRKGRLEEAWQDFHDSVDLDRRNDSFTNNLHIVENIRADLESTIEYLRH